MYELLEKIIKVLVIKRENPVINFTYFMDQLNSYYESNREQLQAKSAEEFRLSAIPVLKRMENEGTCTITYEASKIVSFQVHKYYRQLIMKYYKDLEERPDLPFPDLGSFDFTIDSSWIIPVNLKSSTTDVFDVKESESGKVLLVEFQEGINDVVLPPEIAYTLFFDNVLKKIHIFIQNQNNYAYIGRYLRKACQGNELAVKNMMESVLSGPPNFRKHIKAPEDFAFRFFSFMCNKVMKDIEDKNDKTASDIYTYQAMAMLRIYITSGRAKVQKEAQKKADYKDLASKVKKEPYTYTITDLYDIKDTRGQPYSSKYSRDFINEFVKKETTALENEDLPYLVRINIERNKDYYIQRDMLSRVFLKSVLSAGAEIRDRFFNEWKDLLMKFKKTREMDNEPAFNAELENIVRSDYKLLSALYSNPGLVYLANKSNNVNSQIKASVESCFKDPGKFKNIDAVLGLDRQDLLKQVKASLPITHAIPVIGRFLAAIVSIFRGRKSRSAGKSPGEYGMPADNVYQELSPPGSREYNIQAAGGRSAAGAAGYGDAIKALKKKYLRDNRDINLTLEELAEKWNPLFDREKRQDLVEDINSLIRDFIRSKKRLLIKFPPDEKRIKALTDDLLNKTSKIGIKKQDSFRKNVELYIIKLLDNIKSL